METFVNYNIFLLFLGGFFSLVLSVSIIFAKQEYKRSLEREKLKKVAEKTPETVGDIESKLNDSFDGCDSHLM